MDWLTPYGQIQIQQEGKRLRLIAPRHKDLTAEVKAMKGVKWCRETRTRSVTDCRRNWIQLEILAGQMPVEFERYYADIQPAPDVERPLKDYQLDLLAFGLTRKRCVWASEQGTGKTLTAIQLMDTVGGKWLWVGPAKVLEATRLEFEKWGAEHLDVTFVSYTSIARGNLPKGNFTGIVCDESSRIKESGTKRWRGVRKISKGVEYLLLLSGKPAPNTQVDWWAQVELCCPGWLRESSAKKLEDRIAEKVPSPYGEFQQIIGWKEDEIEALGRRLARIVKVVRACDVQDLPDIRFHRVRIPVEPLTKEIAKTVASQAANPLMALRQISDGFRYIDGDVKRWGAPKEEALRNIIWGAEESGRIVIFAGFRESIDRVVDLCHEEGWLVLRCDGQGFKPESGFSVQDMLREMDAGCVHKQEKVAFVANPMSGGIGLNLTACHTMVFVSQDFNAESRTQAIKRCNRHGSVKDLDVYDLIHLGVDELIIEKIDQKLALGEITLEEILHWLDN